MNVVKVMNMMYGCGGCDGGHGCHMGNGCDALDGRLMTKVV